MVNEYSQQEEWYLQCDDPYLYKNCSGPIPRIGETVSIKDGTTLTVINVHTGLAHRQWRAGPGSHHAYVTVYVIPSTPIPTDVEAVWKELETPMSDDRVLEVVRGLHGPFIARYRNNLAIYGEGITVLDALRKFKEMLK